MAEGERLYRLSDAVVSDIAHLVAGQLAQSGAALYREYKAHYARRGRGAMRVTIAHPRQLLHGIQGIGYLAASEAPSEYAALFAKVLPTITEDVFSVIVEVKLDHCHESGALVSIRSEDAFPLPIFIPPALFRYICGSCLEVLGPRCADTVPCPLCLCQRYCDKQCLMMDCDGGHNAACAVLSRARGGAWETSAAHRLVPLESVSGLPQKKLGQLARYARETAAMDYECWDGLDRGPGKRDFMVTGSEETRRRGEAMITRILSHAHKLFSSRMLKVQGIQQTDPATGIPPFARTIIPIGEDERLADDDAVWKHILWYTTFLPGDLALEASQKDSPPHSVDAFVPNQEVYRLLAGEPRDWADVPAKWYMQRAGRAGVWQVVVYYWDGDEEGEYSAMSSTRVIFSESGPLPAPRLQTDPKAFLKYFRRMAPSAYRALREKKKKKSGSLHRAMKRVDAKLQAPDRRRAVECIMFRANEIRGTGNKDGVTRERYQAYLADTVGHLATRRCTGCNGTSVATLLCSGCRAARYCSRQCQERDWDGWHRQRCEAYQLHCCRANDEQQ